MDRSEISNEMESLHHKIETIRLQGETEGSEQDRRFRNLVGLLPQTVFEVDVQGKLTFCNAVAFEEFGYAQADFENGLYCLDMLVPEQRDRGRRNMAKVFAGERVGPTEYTAQRKDGTTFPILLHSAPILSDNRPCGLRGILVDLTEKKTLNEAVVEAEQDYQQIFNASNDAISIHDIETGIVLDTNRAMCDILRCSRNDALLMTLEDFSEGVPPYDPEHIHYWMKKAVGEGPQFFKWHARRHTGELFLSLIHI